MFGALLATVQRELLIAMRRRGEWLNPLVFFVIVVSLFPLGIGPEPNRLQEIAPGVIWVAALLATLLALDSLFRADFDDGVLEQMMMSAQPLSLLVLGKVLAHWLVTGLPLLLLSPLLGLVMHLHSRALPALVASLFLGTLTLSFIGAIGAALTVALRRGGVLLALLVLPLFIPVLIFGSSCVVAASAGLSIEGQLSLLAALSLFSMVLAPPAIAAALRVSAE